jgi:Zn-dependent protease with chaperone function
MKKVHGGIMSFNRSGRAFFAIFLALLMSVVPVASLAQTRISMPKNKYKVQDDVKIGNQAAREVDQKFPILNDRLAQDYVRRVGERLVAAIPPEFQQPAFDYRFQVVNASDLNAFALPGGPMFVNRGMIESAKNEGELAGVMAHEISHVALRHATAQQTKINSPLNQVLGIGAVLGGAVLGGQSGAQAGQIFAQGYFMRYSREYETQADILGSHIMADAGYDPRDLANVFQTIQQQGGGRGNPEWLSSHPDPGNRYQKINNEASLLRVSPNPIKVTAELRRVQERLRGMGRAPSMQEIQQGVGTRGNQYPNGGGTNQYPTSGGNYSSRVEYPSSQMRVYRSGNWVELNVPSNWEQFESNSSVQFAPEGGYGDQGITHGVMVGIEQPNANNAAQATQNYINSLLQGNSYLRQQAATARAVFAGRSGYSTVLAGRSPITGRGEIVTVYTTQLGNGDLFYVTTVVPQDEASNYNYAFRNVINSIRLNG